MCTQTPCACPLNITKFKIKTLAHFFKKKKLVCLPLWWPIACLVIKLSMKNNYVTPKINTPICRRILYIRGHQQISIRNPFLKLTSIKTFLITFHTLHKQQIFILFDYMLHTVCHCGGTTRQNNTRMLRAYNIGKHFFVNIILCKYKNYITI